MIPARDSAIPYKNNEKDAIKNKNNVLKKKWKDNIINSMGNNNKKII